MGRARRWHPHIQSRSCPQIWPRICLTRAPRQRRSSAADWKSSYTSRKTCENNATARFSSTGVNCRREIFAAKCWMFWICRESNSFVLFQTCLKQEESVSYIEDAQHMSEGEQAYDKPCTGWRTGLVAIA